MDFGELCVCVWYVDSWMTVALRIKLSRCYKESLWMLHLPVGCLLTTLRFSSVYSLIILIQAAQQIIELQEAAQINAGLQPANLGRNTSLHDMKTVVKTWRNRLPIVSDDLSHWSSIFMWRQHHYQGMPGYGDKFQWHNNNYFSILIPFLFFQPLWPLMKQTRNMIQTLTMPCLECTPPHQPLFSMGRSPGSKVWST